MLIDSDHVNVYCLWYTNSYWFTDTCSECFSFLQDLEAKPFRLGVLRRAQVPLLCRVLFGRNWTHWLRNSRARWCTFMIFWYMLHYFAELVWADVHITSTMACSVTDFLECRGMRVPWCNGKISRLFGGDVQHRKQEAEFRKRLGKPEAVRVKGCERMWNACKYARMSLLGPWMVKQNVWRTIWHDIEAPCWMHCGQLIFCFASDTWCRIASIQHDTAVWYQDRQEWLKLVALAALKWQLAGSCDCITLHDTMEQVHVKTTMEEHAASFCTRLLSNTCSGDASKCFQVFYPIAFA